MLDRCVCAMALVVAGACGQAGTGSVSGTVVDQAGAGIGGAAVTIDPPANIAGVANRSGNFLFKDLASGSHTLRFEAAGFWPKELHVNAEAGKVTSLGRVTLDVDSVVCSDGFKTALRHYMTPPTGTEPGIFGVARTEARLALPHILLTLRISGRSEPFATTETARDGSFEFSDVPPGRYDVVAFMEIDQRLLGVSRS